MSFIIVRRRCSDILVIKHVHKYISTYMISAKTNIMPISDIHPIGYQTVSSQ